MLKATELRHPDVGFASGFGLGFLRPAPGTWGSLGAVLVWWWLLAEQPVVLQLAVTVLYFLLGWWCSARVCRRYGVDDAPEIIADEVVGMWLALALLPQQIAWAVGAFVLFRFIDIAKPGPVGWLDRNVKGGLGVMLDDVLGGVVVGIVLYLSLSVLRAQGIAQ